MCGGVELDEHGKRIRVFFPSPKAALPVRLTGGAVEWLPWGKRKEEDAPFPNGGWARLDSICAGRWRRYDPQAALIAVSGYMEKDNEGRSHWFAVPQARAIQGLIAHAGEERRVYVVTVGPPPEHAYIHDRWPRLVAVEAEQADPPSLRDDALR